MFQQRGFQQFVFSLDWVGLGFQYDSVFVRSAHLRVLDHIHLFAHAESQDHDQHNYRILDSQHDFHLCMHGPRRL